LEVCCSRSRPAHELVDRRCAHAGPARNCSSTLRKTKRDDPHSFAVDRVEDARVKRVEVMHIVVDIGAAIFARHPGCADSAVRTMWAIRVVCVKAIECFGCNVEASTVVELAEVLNERTRELCVAMQHEPY